MPPSVACRDAKRQSYVRVARTLCPANALKGMRSVLPVVIACGSASFAAWAGPPFVTDDPEPVERGHWEINSAITDAWSRGQASIGAPGVDANYGLAPDVQLHAQPRFAIERSADGHVAGLDDTEVGIKYRFWDRKRAEDDETLVGVYPMYQLATGKRALGATRGQHQVFLPVWMQVVRGDWTAYGGAGYRVNHGEGSRDSTFTGATLLRKLGGAWQLGGEVFHETSTAIDERATTGFNLGGVRKLTERTNLLFSAGRTYGGATPLSQAYLALQLHF